MFLFYWLVISVLSNYSLFYFYHFLITTFCFSEGDIFSFSNDKEKAISGRKNFHSALSFSVKKKGSLVVGGKKVWSFHMTPLREGWGPYFLLTCHFFPRKRKTSSAVFPIFSPSSTL